MQSVAPATAPATASGHVVPTLEPKKQPLFSILRCVLINRHGRILATGHMKAEDFNRRNDMLSRNGLTCRWRELPGRSSEHLA